MADKNKPLAFVIMPFAKAKPSRTGLKWDKPSLNKDDLDTIFDIIKRSLSKRYHVERSAGPGEILQNVILNLHRADLVVADLSGLNANVLYELGIRHSIAKESGRNLLITQDIQEVPFDLDKFFHVEYSWTTTVAVSRFKRGGAAREGGQPVLTCVSDGLQVASWRC